jgi:hypothetical protein
VAAMQSIRACKKVKHKTSKLSSLHTYVQAISSCCHLTGKKT